MGTNKHYASDGGGTSPIIGKGSNGNPKCGVHRCYLINLDAEAMIGQCPDSGWWWTYSHLQKKKKIKKIMKIINGKLQEVNEENLIT